MHIILIAAILLLLLFLILRQGKSANQNYSTITHNTDNSRFSDMTFAWLAKGKLFLHNRTGKPEQIQSTYIQNLIDKNEQKQQRHSWKQGTSWSTTPTGGVRQFSNEGISVKFTSAQYLPDNKLIYFLEGEGFGGLFRYDLTNKEELRLSHQQNLSYQDLNHSSARKQILCSSNHDTGVSNIILMDENGDSTRELTGGDTVDSHPDWLDNASSQIVYQSQGIARSTEGYVIALGPASIQLLDTEKGDVTSILEDEQFDYLSPQVSNTGDLYFIRRPFEMPSYKANNFILDTLLFPFRLLRAIFHYLNFFSLIYSKQPLTSADSPYVEADMKNILLQGKRIDAEQALKKSGKVMGIPSLVPKNWMLIKKDRHGTETTLANSVAAFQLTEDARIIYTNGNGVFGLDNTGNAGVLLKNELVSELVH